MKSSICSTALARALESVGGVEEAATLYQRIVRIRPNFKDAALQNEAALSCRGNPPKIAKRSCEHPLAHRSSQALDSLHQLIGSRR